MKKVVMLGLFMGLLIGLLQANFVYIKASSPGASGGVAVANSVTFYRGWPLANAGVVGYNDSFHNPPKNSRTYGNILFWVAVSPLILALAYTAFRRLSLSRKASMIIVASTIIGAGFGVAQIFYTKSVLRPTPSFDMSIAADCDQKVAACGYCPEAQRQGNYCTYPPFEQKVRGWPLVHDTYDQLSRYDKSPTLLMNFAIITGAFAVTGSLLGFAFGRNNKRPRSKKKK